MGSAIFFANLCVHAQRPDLEGDSGRTPRAAEFRRGSAPDQLEEPGALPGCKAGLVNNLKDGSAWGRISDGGCERPHPYSPPW